MLGIDDSILLKIHLVGCLPSAPRYLAHFTLKQFEAGLLRFTFGGFKTGLMLIKNILAGFAC